MEKIVENVAVKGISFCCNASMINEVGFPVDVRPNRPAVPVVVEGVELINTLMPVSKFTGKRESPFKLLGKITGANADLLQAVLQELPVIASDSRLSDEDRIACLVDRLSTGTPAEDALMAERLMADLDALGLSSKVESQVNSDGSKIDFADTVVPKSE